MNKIKRKLRKSNKVLRYIYYIVGIIYIVSLLLFVKSLMNLSGIETVLRIIIIVFFILFIVFYAFYNLLNLLQRKYKGLVFTSFIALLFILIFNVGSYYINIIYQNIDNLTEKEELEYSIYLITLKDTKLDDNGKIGIISEESDDGDHDLASKLYKKEKLANETVNYDDYIKMLSDLYNGVIAAAFMPGNYLSMYSEEEGFEKISSDTKVIHKYSEKRKNEDLEIKSNKDFSEPLTILLMGVDSEKNGLNANAGFNGDTLMLISLNPKTLNAVMLSLPRDTYVPIACRNNNYAKINSAAAYGTSCVINTINNLLDINIDYYAKINFKGVVELVDAIGGVEVDVEKPYFKTNHGVNYQGKVCEQNSNREFGDKVICMDPGLQTLNGEQALAYSRNRHQYIGSDLDRIRHQQQVVEAIAGKVLRFSSIKDFQKILSAISNNVAINMDTDTILSGYQVIKNMVGNLITGKDVLNISKAYLETYSLNVYVPSQGRHTSAQGYYKDSLEDIKKAINVTLDKEKEDPIKTFSFSVNSEYKIKSPGKGIRTGSSGTLLPSFVGKTISEAEKFCADNKISFDVKYVDSGSEHYNSSVNVGLIGSQSVHKDVLLSTVKSLTVYVVNSKPSSNEDKKDDDSKKPSNSGDEELDKIINDILQN